MGAGIRDLLIISTPHDLPLFQRLFAAVRRLGHQSQLLLRQPKPEGIAQAFLIGADFVGDDPIR